jgi:hypothetical protein
VEPVGSKKMDVFSLVVGALRVLLAIILETGFCLVLCIKRYTTELILADNDNLL